MSWDSFDDGLTAGPVQTDPPVFAESYVGNVLVTILTPTFAISPSPVKSEPAVDDTLTASTSGFTHRALVTSTFIWNFGDGTAPVMKLGDSTVVHQWAQVGTYTLTAQLQDSTGTIIAADSTTVTIKETATYVWQFQSITLTTKSVPALITKSDTTISNFVNAWITDVTANPTDGGIQVYGVPTGGAICPGFAAVVNFPGGQWTDTTSFTLNRAVVGVCGRPHFMGNLTVGPLGAGTIVGTAVGTSTPTLVVFPGGSIRATMTGKTLTGSFVAFFPYSTGNGSYTFGFTAKQVKP